MAQNITLLGASYSDVPAVDLPKTGGGTATFTDTTPTTASASDVLQGKYFFTANGVLTLGTNQGGSGDGYVWQDAQGYIHLSDEQGTQIVVDSLTVNAGGTYTAQTGHAYSPVTVASGTAGTPTATKGSVSNHSVSVTPSVTNTSGYITGSTKTGTAVTVSASELVSGTKSITENGTGIDVTNYASVDVSVSGGSPTLITKSITANGTYNASSDNADGYSSVTVNVSGGGAVKKGVLRPDAELVQKWTLDKLLVEDLEYSIPAYSTSSQTIVSAGTIFDASVSTDLTNYNYFVSCYGITIPIYNQAFISNGKVDWAINTAVYESMYYAPTDVKTLDGSDHSYTAIQITSLIANSSNYILYRASNPERWQAYNGNYGGYMTFQQPTISIGDANISIKSPSLQVRGSTTYFNSAYWGYMTDIRYQYVVELYRVPVDTVGANGWRTSSLVGSILNDIDNNNGTLT